ncbi:hypothetical protein JX266_002841 [Neoarthrinium moseri]|nr:hypothetical protein JX266_002841 [Neoarthrinium moseri]
MSRLPDSFLPSGAFQDPNEYPLSLSGLVSSQPSSSSVISPLALPRNANQLSYFDERQLSRHSSASAALPQSQQRRYLSPQGRSAPTGRVQRSTSLSPTRHSQQNQYHSRVISPTLAPLNESPEQASHHLQRVLLQNRRLLENWEAERAHLEANRSRAEEIYKEERAIMDEDRLIWAEKEAQYLTTISELERENAELRESLARYTNRGSRDSAVAGMGAGSSDMSDVSAVEFRLTSDSVSPGTTPIPGLGHTMPESHPFEPLDPRMQGTSPQNSPNEAPSSSQEKIPSIDVQEVHPDLEGIPLKTTAVKKSTFMDGKPPSPPLSGSNATGPNSNQGSPSSRSKTSPAELVMEALQAPEASRLTMHAGHTPNHSLSTFQSAVATDASNTAGSSGASTPTHSQRYTDIKGKSIAEAGITGKDGQQDTVEGHPDALLRPSDDDRELSGPLSLRNQQAFDEIFLGKVADKLQDSIQSDNATPTVLKTGLSEPEDGSSYFPQPKAVVGDDDSAENDQPSQPDEAGEIPLKFKNNSNFGAPLGTLNGF